MNLLKVIDRCFENIWEIPMVLGQKWLKYTQSDIQFTSVCIVPTQNKSNLKMLYTYDKFKFNQRQSISVYLYSNSIQFNVTQLILLIPVESRFKVPKKPSRLHLHFGAITHPEQAWGNSGKEKPSRRTRLRVGDYLPQLVGGLRWRERHRDISPEISVYETQKRTKLIPVMMTYTYNKSEDNRLRKEKGKS